MAGRIMLLIAVLGIILYGTSDSYADHSEVVIVPVDGSSIAGCQDEGGCNIPMVATVDVGGVVIFQNTDSVAHTFTAGTVADGPSGEFDSGLALPGTSYEYTAEEVGEIQYYCLVHPWRTGLIVVQERHTGEVEPQSTLDGTINVGILVPLSGDLASHGEERKLSAELGISDFNEYLAEKGATWSLSAIVEDSQTNPVIALEKVTAMHTKGAKVVIGPASSTVLRNISGYATANDMILISYSSTAPSLAVEGDNIFRTAPDDNNQGQVISKLAAFEGIEALVPLYRGDAWGDGLYESAVNSFRSGGYTIDEGVRYNPEAPEHSASTSLLANKVQEYVDEYGTNKVGVLVLAFGEVTLFMQSASTHDILGELKWFGSDGSTNEQSLVKSEIGREFAERTDFATVQFSPSDNPAKQRVTEKIMSEFGRIPNVYAYSAYDAVWLAGLAMEAAGSTDTAAVKANMIPVSETHTGAVGPLKLNAAGDLNTDEYAIWTIRNGQWTVIGSTSDLSAAVTAGTIFSDVNRNAEHDAGEAGLEGIIVLCTPHGSPNNAMRITTDSTGSYRFETQSGCYLTQAEIPGWTTGDPDAHAYTAEHPGQSMTLNFPSWQSDLCVSGYVLSDGQCTQNQQVSSQLLDSLLATIQLIRDELSGLNSKLDRLNAETDGVSSQLENLRSTVPADPDPVPRDPIDTTTMHITTDKQIYTIADTITVTGMVPIAEPLVEPTVYADGSSKLFVSSDYAGISLTSAFEPSYYNCDRDYPFDRERFDRLQEYYESNLEFGKFYDGEVECPIASDGSFTFTGVIENDSVGSRNVEVDYRQRGSSHWHDREYGYYEIRAPTVTTEPIPEPNHTIQASLDKTDYVYGDDMVTLDVMIAGYTPNYDRGEVKIVISKDGHQYSTFKEYLNADGSFQLQFYPHDYVWEYGTYTIELSYFGIKHELEFNYLQPPPEPRDPIDTTQPYITTDKTAYTLGDTIIVTGKIHPSATPLISPVQTLDGTEHHVNFYYANVDFELAQIMHYYNYMRDLKLDNCSYYDFENLSSNQYTRQRDALGPTQEPGKYYQYDNAYDEDGNAIYNEDGYNQLERTECGFASDGSFSFTYDVTADRHADLTLGKESISVRSGQSIKTESGSLGSDSWRERTYFELHPVTDVSVTERELAVPDRGIAGTPSGHFEAPRVQPDTMTVSVTDTVEIPGIGHHTIIEVTGAIPSQTVTVEILSPAGSMVDRLESLAMPNGEARHFWPSDKIPYPGAYTIISRDTLQSAQTIHHFE